MCLVCREHQPPKLLDLGQYQEFLTALYSKQYARSQFNNSIRYYECLHNPSLLLTMSENKRLNVLKAIVCLSKYLGCYEEYKTKLRNYGIKWSSQNIAFNGFLSIFSKKHDSLPLYMNEIKPILKPNEQLFFRFLAVTGLRKNEAITSFNMIIRLDKESKLDEYYNSNLCVLEHFKYNLFLRRTKNAYISFVSQNMIKEICSSQPVTYNAIHCRFARRNVKLRLKELRSYHNSYLRNNGIISELIDVLSGRVPKSVFCRHYLGANLKTLSKEVIAITNQLERSLMLTPLK